MVQFRWHSVIHGPLLPNPLKILQDDHLGLGAHDLLSDSMVLAGDEPSFSSSHFP